MTGKSAIYFDIQNSTPRTPPAGKWAVYLNSAGQMVAKKPDGSVVNIVSGGSITRASEAWIELGTGSDVTGAVGNPALPFATIGAALTAGATVFILGVGAHAGFTAPTGGHSYSIQGAGANLTTVGAVTLTAGGVTSIQDVGNKSVTIASVTGVGAAGVIGATDGAGTAGGNAPGFLGVNLLISGAITLTGGVGGAGGLLSAATGTTGGAGGVGGQAILTDSTVLHVLNLGGVGGAGRGDHDGGIGGAGGSIFLTRSSVGSNSFVTGGVGGVAGAGGNQGNGGNAGIESLLYSTVNTLDVTGGAGTAPGANGTYDAFFSEIGTEQPVTPGGSQHANVIGGAFVA